MRPAGADGASPMVGDLLAQIAGIGRVPQTGGYRRLAWTHDDAALREWFRGQAESLGLTVAEDRVGNQWAWWGDPDASIAAGRPPVVTGSHLDSVPDGGNYDGPLGVASALAAIAALKRQGFTRGSAIGVVNFVDEEGARFGVACSGSRVLAGALDRDKALGLTDADGTTMAEALARAGRDIDSFGQDQEAVGRVGTFVELHVEQGRCLAGSGHPVAVGTSIWPHGRWRFDFAGEANHAGTTRLEDRDDPMLKLATLIRRARERATELGCFATVGKVRVLPNAVNAIPSSVTGWLDARGADESAVRSLAPLLASELGVDAVTESLTEDTRFDSDLASRLSTMLGGAPMISTGAGHDAGVLAGQGVRSAMLFVRNPTGVSHSPAEHAEPADCDAGAAALTTVLRALAG